ncbi:MAG: tetratricopeptide repeat protein [bacterium]
MPGLDADRYALMESLVERGTTCVDEATFASVDRARLNGHFYSEKPPLLSFAGAGVYFILHHGPGWNFRENSSQIVRVMIAFFVIIPLCFLLWMFHALLSRQHCGWKGAIIATTLPALASLLLTYGVCFTNHPLAGALLFAAFYTGFDLRDESCMTNTAVSAASPCLRYFAVGFLSALSAAVDLLPGAIFFAAYLAFEFRRMSIRSMGFLLTGAMIPAVLHVILNRAATGLWLPAYFVHERNLYAGSIWRADSMIAGDYEPFPNYLTALYHYTIGHRGVFFFMPLMLYGLIYASKSARSMGAGRAGLALTVLATFVITLLATPAISLGLAGGSYGPRHIVTVTALVYFYAVNEFRRKGRAWRTILAACLVAWSAAIAWTGALDPWTPGTLSVYAPLDVLAARAARLSNGWSLFAQNIADKTAYSRPFAYYELGRIYREQGKMNEAIYAYKHSLDLDPNRPLAHYALGSTSGMMGRMAIAIEAFDKLVQIEPANAGAWANLGISLLNTPRAIEARAPLEKGLTLNPHSRAALSGLAEWHGRFGNAENAREFTRKLDMITSPSRPLD